MLRPDATQLRAFQELRAQPHVVEFLRACSEDLKTRLVTQGDAEIFRILQGQARAVEFLTDLILSDSGKR